MSESTQEQEQHLKLLSVFHYVVGGLLGLFACFPLIYVVAGTVAVLVPGMFDGSDQLPELLGWFFIIMGGIFVLVGWAMAVCVLLAGKFLARRTHYTYCLVVAAIECVFMPFGTVLGVFTLIVLTKVAVKEMFEDTLHAH